jgi:hypothetical protein
MRGVHRAVRPDGACPRHLAAQTRKAKQTTKKRTSGATTASASRRKVSVKNMFQRIHRDVYSVIIGLLILAGLITLLLLKVNPIV